MFSQHNSLFVPISPSGDVPSHSDGSKVIATLEPSHSDGSKVIATSSVATTSGYCNQVVDTSFFPCGSGVEGISEDPVLFPYCSRGGRRQSYGHYSSPYSSWGEVSDYEGLSDSSMSSGGYDYYDEDQFFVEGEAQELYERQVLPGMTRQEEKELWRYCMEEAARRIGRDVEWHHPLSLSESDDDEPEEPLSEEDDAEYNDAVAWNNSQVTKIYSYVQVDGRLDTGKGGWTDVSHKSSPPLESSTTPLKSSTTPPQPPKSVTRARCPAVTRMIRAPYPPTVAPWLRNAEAAAAPAPEILQLACDKKGKPMVQTTLRHQDERIFIVRLPDNRGKFMVCLTPNGDSAVEVMKTPSAMEGLDSQNITAFLARIGQKNTKQNRRHFMPCETTLTGSCAAGDLLGDCSACLCDEIAHLTGTPVNEQHNTPGSKHPLEVAICQTARHHLGMPQLDLKPKNRFERVMEQQLKNSPRNVQVPVQTPEDRLRDSIYKVISIVCKKREWLHNYSKEIRSDRFRGLFENWLTNASRDNGYHLGLHAVFSLAQQLFTISQDKRSQRHRDQKLGLEEKNAIIHVLSKIPCTQDARSYLNKDGERHRKQGRGCSTDDCRYAHFDTLVNGDGTLDVQMIGISVDGDRQLNCGQRNYDGLDIFFGCLPSVLNISSREFPIKFRAPTNHQSESEVHESLRRYENRTIVQGPEVHGVALETQVLELQRLSPDEKKRISSYCDPVKGDMVARIIEHPQSKDKYDELKLASYDDKKLINILIDLYLDEGRAQAQREAAVKAEEMREKIAEERTKRKRLALMTPEQRGAIAEEERKRSHEGKKAKKAAMSKFTKIWTGWR